MLNFILYMASCIHECSSVLLKLTQVFTTLRMTKLYNFFGTKPISKKNVYNNRFLFRLHNYMINCFPNTKRSC